MNSRVPFNVSNSSSLNNMSVSHVNPMTKKGKETTPFTTGPADLAKMALNSNEGHYVSVENCINKYNGYRNNARWLCSALGRAPNICSCQVADGNTFKGKTKSCCFKLMVNGFFQPHEVVGMTGGQLSETPLGQALKAYALSKLSMDSKDVIFALNAKIATMTRAVKYKRAPEAQPENQTE
ncbi:unnamed protein product [Mytilus edulis]|uniref:Uncharacterized protein n=1 Tax=Mytilus edulis TaxID=6550 RepID=A0A8S3RLI4_MYTED|nr:unnamed protein product [Mytilus edulis]